MILRPIWASDPSVLAAAFVDMEGECVDYVASIDPFDAKVIGAQLLVVMLDAAERLRTIAHGEALELMISAEHREFLVRRLDDDYLVVVATEGGALNKAIIAAVDRAAVTLGREAGMHVPPVPRTSPSSPPPDPTLRWVDVELRPSARWDYAPVAFEESTALRGGSSASTEPARMAVVHVLGRYRDGEQVCFRIRAEDGRELTLAHDLPSGRWLLLQETKR